MLRFWAAPGALTLPRVCLCVSMTTPLCSLRAVVPSVSAATATSDAPPVLEPPVKKKRARADNVESVSSARARHVSYCLGNLITWFPAERAVERRLS